MWVADRGFCLIAAGKYHEQVHIESNSVGHSYERLFGRFLDASVTAVEVEDPYIMNIHQVFVGSCQTFLPIP